MSQKLADMLLVCRECFGPAGKRARSLRLSVRNMGWQGVTPGSTYRTMNTTEWIVSILMDYVAIEFFCTFRANAMAEISLRVLTDI